MVWNTKLFGLFQQRCLRWIIDDVGNMPDSVGMVEVEGGFLILHDGTGRVDQQVAIQVV